MTEYVADGSVAPAPEALRTGAAGVPSASEALPPNSAVSSLRIVFCSTRSVAVELTSSNPCAAASASKVTVSSSPSVTYGATWGVAT